MTLDRLEQLLGRIPDLRIAVLGDFFLDKYLITDPALSEISIETGLEARQVVEIRTSPGAAGTVTNNLSALGVETIHAAGCIGADGEGYDLQRGLQATRVNTEWLLAVADRFTPTYTKPMVRTPDGERELERLDIKNRITLKGEYEERLSTALAGIVTEVDAVIIADQVQERNCGVITDRVRDAIADLAKQYPDILFFSDSRVRIGQFQNVTIKPNKYEAARALHPAWNGEVTLSQAKEIGGGLAARNGKTVFLTVGEEGILVCEPDNVQHVRAPRVEGPIDIVGAGDSTTAAIVCALCAGASPIEAAMLGNLCASVTIRKLGTTGTASVIELRQALAAQTAY
jgi:rfaE bifunctional protein kinase chain/domain